VLSSCCSSELTHNVWAAVCCCITTGNGIRKKTCNYRQMTLKFILGHLVCDCILIWFLLVVCSNNVTVLDCIWDISFTAYLTAWDLEKSFIIGTTLNIITLFNSSVSLGKSAVFSQVLESERFLNIWNILQGHSGSFMSASFDGSHMIPIWCPIVTMSVCYTISEILLLSYGRDHVTWTCPFGVLHRVVQYSLCLICISNWKYV